MINEHEFDIESAASEIPLAIDWVAFDEMERWEVLSERDKLAELGAPAWMVYDEGQG